MEREGYKIDALDDAPVLLVDAEPYWTAFSYLHSSRPVGFGEGAIPVLEIKAYLDMIGVTDIEETLSYLRFIKALDQHYLEAKSKRQNHKRENNGT